MFHVPDVVRRAWMGMLEAPTPEEFPTLQAAGLTMGLTCDEFGTMINKYGEVLAIRIVENSGALVHRPQPELATTG